MSTYSIVCLRLSWDWFWGLQPVCESNFTEHRDRSVSHVRAAVSQKVLGFTCIKIRTLHQTLEVLWMMKACGNCLVFHILSGPSCHRLAQLLFCTTLLFEPKRPRSKQRCCASPWKRGPWMRRRSELLHRGDRAFADIRNRLQKRSRIKVFRKLPCQQCSNSIC